MEKRGRGGTSGEVGTGESTSRNSEGDGSAIWGRGQEVNMSDVMDQIQSLLAQYVIRRREVKADLPSYKVA